MKLPALGVLSLESRVAIAGESETRGTKYALLAGGEGAVVATHLAYNEAPPERDFVAVAERFVETPYLWGGRTSIGLDCSALVQLSLAACGYPAPRDTDLQDRLLAGTPVPGGHEGTLARGDLVFWKGHVGIMIDGDRMVHASGYHMIVVVEKLGDAVRRIVRTAGTPTTVLRLPADA
jgi:cell wall-associated NlpC family hydrolase